MEWEFHFLDEVARMVVETIDFATLAEKPHPVTVGCRNEAFSIYIPRLLGKRPTAHHLQVGRVE